MGVKIFSQEGNLTKVKRLSVKCGDVMIDGKAFTLTKVKNTCAKCGSTRVEMSYCRKSELTGKVHGVWKCWDCEVNYDAIEVHKTREGVFLD